MRVGPWRDAHHHETKNSYYGHEDTGPLSEGERVHLNEWLRGIERKERVQVRDTKEEQNGRYETEHACGNGAADDASASNYAVEAGTKIQFIK